MPLNIVLQDITKMKVDAIVNAANTALRMGEGVCGAIFKAAGEKDMTNACKGLAPIKTGEAVITPGFKLPSKYVIHAAGPVYQKDSPQCEQQLRSAYTESLKLAVENGCESIAFPLISSGIFKYPKDEALQVARNAIQDFLKEHDIDVYLVIFDRKAFIISKELFGEVTRYIDENYIAERRQIRRKLIDVEDEAIREARKYQNFIATTAMSKMDSMPVDDIEGYVEKLDEPFSKTLLRLIDEKGMSDVEVYKRANIDRRLFSKIRTGGGYKPSKRTVLALAIALRLNLDETKDLLMRAGYALSRSQREDLIIEYFIINRKYNIFEINEVLFQYNYPALGGL